MGCGNKKRSDMEDLIQVKEAAVLMTSFSMYRLFKDIISPLNLARAKS